MPNMYETFKRAEKVDKLLEILAAHKISAELARDMNTADWHKVAEAAGCNPPSVRTIEEALKRLAQADRLAGAA